VRIESGMPIFPMSWKSAGACQAGPLKDRAPSRPRAPLGARAANGRLYKDPRLDRGIERLNRIEQPLLEFIDRFDELPISPPHTAGIGIAAGELRVGLGCYARRYALGVEKGGRVRLFVWAAIVRPDPWTHQLAARRPATDHGTATRSVATRLHPLA